MNNLKQKWWAPLVSHPLAFLILVVGLPYFIHKIHFNHDVTLGLIGVGAAVSLVLLAKLHHFPLKLVLVFVAVDVFLIWLNWPKEQLGNWNTQRADIILINSLWIFAVSAILQSINLYRKNSNRHAA